jgi:hypothetical protein
MNKRVKELANEATVWCEQHAQGTPVAWEWEEKFAELIVQECASVCLSQRDPGNLNYKPSESFACALKEHFGIK